MQVRLERGRDGCDWNFGISISPKFTRDSQPPCQQIYDLRKSISRSDRPPTFELQEHLARDHSSLESAKMATAKIRLANNVSPVTKTNSGTKASRLMLKASMSTLAPHLPRIESRSNTDTQSAPSRVLICSLNATY